MLKEFIISTKNKNDFVNITEEILEIIDESKVDNGICTIFTPHATAAITINENYDKNVCIDIINALNKVVKEDGWKHDKVDKNGAAHIKSAIIGPSETIPIKNGKLMLGTWQNILLCDFNGPRERKVFVTLLNEK